jgi:hypothetical protein
MQQVRRGQAVDCGSRIADSGSLGVAGLARDRDCESLGVAGLARVLDAETSFEPERGTREAGLATALLGAVTGLGLGIRANSATVAPLPVTNEERPVTFVSLLASGVVRSVAVIAQRLRSTTGWAKLATS